MVVLENHIFMLYRTISVRVKMSRASGTIDVEVWSIHHNELWCYNIDRAEWHFF